MFYQVNNYNVNIYPDSIKYKNHDYYLITIDKFDNKDNYIGHKHYYFEYRPKAEEFTNETINNLWDFPIGTIIQGQKIIWRASQI